MENPRSEDLYDINNKVKNGETIKHINNALIELKNSINRNEISKNENPEKIVDIVEKNLDFNKQQKGKGRPRMLALQPSDFCPVAGIANVSDHSYLEILTPKQMRQILPTVVSQVKAGTTSEKILNEIRYIVHYLH